MVEAAPKEVLEEVESRLREETVDIGDDDKFSVSIVLAALRSVISDTFEARLVLRTASEDDGRLLITEWGRDGVHRPLPDLVSLLPGGV